TMSLRTCEVTFLRWLKSGEFDMVSNVAAANLINHIKESSDRGEKEEFEETEFRIQETECTSLI
ncbi:MAG: hypothetical protein RID25_20590, partial [Cyclobacteriaceae bacterium]